MSYRNIFSDVIKMSEAFFGSESNLKHFIGKLEGNPFIVSNTSRRRREVLDRSFIINEVKTTSLHCQNIIYFHNFFRYVSAKVFCV